MSGGGNACPSIIDYARFHGLSIDHLSQDDDKCLLQAMATKSKERAVPEFRVPHAGDIPPEPKFRLDRKAASLLSSCLQSPPKPDWPKILPDHRRAKRLKIEQPVLRTDHAADMKKIRCRELPKISPPRPVFVNKAKLQGQCLAWPTRIRALSANWDKKIAAEKLRMSWAVFKALQDTLNPRYNPETLESLMAKDLRFSKRSRLEPGTPPQLRCELNQVPAISSSPDLDLPKAIDRSSEDYKRADRAKQFDSDSRGITSEDITHGAVSQSDRHFKIVEDSPASDELSSATPRQNSPIDGDTPGSTRTEQRFKNKSLAIIAEEGKEAIGDHPGRQLSKAADMSLFVEVPPLDGINTTAPDADATDGETFKTLLDGHPKRTRQNVQKSKQVMRWAAVPSEFLKSITRYNIEPPPQLTDVVSQPALNFTIEDLAWKPERLHASCMDEEHGEDLQCAFSLKDSPPRESPQPPPPKRTTQTHQSKLPLKRRPHQLTLPEREVGSPTFGSLARFLDTRPAHKRQRLQSTPSQEISVQPATAEMAVAVSKPLAQSQPRNEPMASPIVDLASFAVPQMPNVDSSRTIIANSKLLNSHRQLIRALETGLDPPLVVICRDLEKVDAKSAQPDIIISPTVAAILTTLQETTQRALPGQGFSRGPLFSRILELSQLYERLLVITTLPPSDGFPLSSMTICSQIPPLVSFCASLSEAGSQASVECIQVPTQASRKSILSTESKTYQPLHQWTEFLILKYALDPSCTPGLPLLPDETLWELFLRKAGMNPYAAQVVLGTLKKPDRNYVEAGVPPAQRQEHVRILWGLRALVQMGRGERMVTFESLVGRRAVERLNEVIDSAWGQIEGGVRL